MWPSASDITDSRIQHETWLSTPVTSIFTFWAMIRITGKSRKIGFEYLSHLKCVIPSYICRNNVWFYLLTIIPCGKRTMVAEFLTTGIISVAPVRIFDLTRKCYQSVSGRQSSSASRLTETNDSELNVIVSSLGHGWRLVYHACEEQWDK